VTPVSHDDREPGAPAYVAVWLALVVLATRTLFLSRAVTGGWGLIVALVIATVKAVLVAAFFMHLAYGRPTHRLVFAVAIGSSSCSWSACWQTSARARSRARTSTSSAGRCSPIARALASRQAAVEDAIGEVWLARP
jgi:caa(3)-type oxidase subunit IV